MIFMILHISTNHQRHHFRDFIRSFFARYEVATKPAAPIQKPPRRRPVTPPRTPAVAMVFLETRDPAGEGSVSASSPGHFCSRKEVFTNGSGRNWRPDTFRS